MKFIDQVSIENKKVLLRVDFNVPLNSSGSISDDSRIRETVKTIKYLLDKKNKVIIVSHLGRPRGGTFSENVKGENVKGENELSLEKATRQLHKYLSSYNYHFIRDFLSDSHLLLKQKNGEFSVLENIRFYPEESENDAEFAKRLASLGDVYVNDAFAVSHRRAASIVAVTKYLPSYGGLLMKREVTMLKKATDNPKKPYVAIIGGKKISTKIKFLSKLTKIVDDILLSGGLANTFLAARSINIGKSLYRKEELSEANYLTSLARRHGTRIHLPEDAIAGSDPNGTKSEVKLLDNLKKSDMILDIGPKTQAVYETIISRAKTIVWNGPLGYFENPLFRRGTDFIYYAIEQNPKAVSIIGGGDTIAAISGHENLDQIDHISTGGGAMLAFIEHGTLVGIDALEKHTE